MQPPTKALSPQKREYEQSNFSTGNNNPYRNLVILSDSSYRWMSGTKGGRREIKIVKQILLTALKIGHNLTSTTLSFLHQNSPTWLAIKTNTGEKAQNSIDIMKAHAKSLWASRQRHWLGYIQRHCTFHSQLCHPIWHTLVHYSVLTSGRTIEVVQKRRWESRPPVKARSRCPSSAPKPKRFL